MKETNTTKYLKVENADLLDNIHMKDKLVQEGRDISKKIDDLENERNKIGMQIQKLKDKIIPVAEELVKPALAEFDMLTRVLPDVDAEGKETGLVALEYIDQIEDFKDALREKMNGGKSLVKVAQEMEKEAKEIGLQQNNEAQNTTN